MPIPPRNISGAIPRRAMAGLRANKIIAVVFMAPALLYAAPAPDFSHDIQPILQKHCYACHGPQMQMKNVRLDNRQAALRVIQPGDSQHSRLIDMVTGKDGKFMPPSGPHLSDPEIAALRSWID